MTAWTGDDGKMLLGWRIVLGILLAVAADYLAGAIASAAANSQRSFEAVFWPTLLLLLLGWFSALLLFADHVEGNPVAALGLGRSNAVADSLFGVATGALSIVVGVAIVATAARLSTTMRVTGHTVLLATVELFILSTAAMCEELMFRGYPFQRILEGAGPAAAIIVLSIFFGVAHMRNPHVREVLWVSLFNTILVGVLLAFAYLRVRNLWLPWGFHFAWNTTLGLICGLPVSGITDFAVVVRTKAFGPVWLTGGAYGIEGGLAGTLAILFGFIPLYAFTRHRTPLVQPSDSPTRV